MPITVSDDFMAWKYVVKELDYCPRKNDVNREGELLEGIHSTVGGKGRLAGDCGRGRAFGPGKKRAYAP
jgi:hypothetical protein